MIWRLAGTLNGALVNASIVTTPGVANFSMAAPMTSDNAPGEAAMLVWRWAHEVCLAPSVSAVELARALQVDVGEAESLGRQRIFPPLPETSHMQFVLGPDEKTVIFIELRTSGPMTVHDPVLLL